MPANVIGLPARPENGAARSHRTADAPATAPRNPGARGRDSPKWATANGGGNL